MTWGQVFLGLGLVVLNTVVLVRVLIVTQDHSNLERTVRHLADEVDQLKRRAARSARKTAAKAAAGDGGSK